MFYALETMNFMTKIILFVILNFLFINKSYSFEDEKIYLYVQNRPPYFIFDKKNEIPIDGITYKIVRKILNSSNISYEFNNIPLVRAIPAIKENKLKICYPNAVKNKEREEISYFTKPFYKDKKSIIIIKKNNFKFNDYKNFVDILKNNNFNLLLKVGYSYGDYIKKQIYLIKKYNNSFVENHLPQGIILSTKDHEKMLYEIKDNIADYMILGRNEAEYFFEKDPVLKNYLEMKELNDFPEGEKRYLMCSKKVGTELIKKIDIEIMKIYK